MIRFLPPEARPEFRNLGRAVDRALRAYVRGQALVCLLMGTLVGVALAAFQCPAPVLLGLVVGLGELIPYLGFVLAAFAIVVAGSSVSPFCAWAGLGSYVAINWIVP